MSCLQLFHLPRWRPAIASCRASTTSTRLPSAPASIISCNQAVTSTRSSAFSTSSAALAGKTAKAGKKSKGKKGKGAPTDGRVKLIRYFLAHPVLPRPLRLSRLRTLRHWTIHRAWLLYQRSQRRQRQLTLERQYMSMRNACEALRLIGEDGLAIPEPRSRAVRPAGARDLPSVKVEFAREGAESGVMDIDVEAAASRQKDVGRLFRQAMQKGGIYQGVPIEYARGMVDTPSRTGWDHGWQRPVLPPQ